MVFPWMAPDGEPIPSWGMMIDHTLRAGIRTDAGISSVGFCVAMLLLAACDDAARTGDASSVNVASLPAAVPIASPAAPGSAEPNLSTAPDGRVLLSWVETVDSTHALRFAVLGDSGWSDPRMIAQGADWFVNWADFPSLIQLDDGTLAAHWLQRAGDGTYAYGVRIARSDDGGATWSAPVTPHRDSTAAEHGFVTLYDAGDGKVGAVWLDGRRYAAGSQEMTLRHATIDTNGELGDDAELDARVCDCCQTSVAQTDNGIVAYYRDRSGDEIRDIAATALTDGEWSHPVRVHADEWRINACPVNGPQADASGSNVALAWFTAPDDSARVNVAFSHDGGLTFDAPVRVDDGAPAGRVDLLLLDDGSAVVSWLERVDGAAEIRLRRVTPAGAYSASSTVSRTSEQRASGFPRMTRSGSMIVLAWTVAEGDVPQVHTAHIDVGGL